MAVNTPIKWTDQAGQYRLAYCRGWDDARLYSIVLIDQAKPSAWEGDQVATVDDFGDLVVIGDKAGIYLPYLKPRWPLHIVLGHLEEH